LRTVAGALGASEVSTARDIALFTGAGPQSGYGALALLERCSDQYVNGASLSVSRDRIARIEKSAAAMGIDVRAAKNKAQQDSKANMDMFEALGSMNCQQRDSLKQFCALQGMTLLQASKHFAELDRAAGR